MSSESKSVGREAPPPHLRVTGIHKRFGGVYALSGVDFEVANTHVMLQRGKWRL